jgi:hypothetical protein
VEGLKLSYQSAERGEWVFRRMAFLGRPVRLGPSEISLFHGRPREAVLRKALFHSIGAID